MAHLVPSREPRMVARMFLVLDHVAENVRLHVLLPAPDLGEERPIEAAQIPSERVGPDRRRVSVVVPAKSGHLVPRGVVG